MNKFSFSVGLLKLPKNNVILHDRNKSSLFLYAAPWIIHLIRANISQNQIAMTKALPPSAILEDIIPLYRWHLKAGHKEKFAPDGIKINLYTHWVYSVSSYFIRE